MLINYQDGELLSEELSLCISLHIAIGPGLGPIPSRGLLSIKQHNKSSSPSSRLSWYMLASKALVVLSVPHLVLFGTRITVRSVSDDYFVVFIPILLLPLQPLGHPRARLLDYPQEDDDKAGGRHGQVSHSSN